MDKVILKKKSKFKRWYWAAIASTGFFGALSWSLIAPASQHYRASVEGVEIQKVTYRDFAETVTIRGTLVPEVSIFLDAIEGGRVEQVLVEDGAMVSQGQPLLLLSNTSLQLDVISREAQISEQLNNLQNTRLAVEQNSLRLDKELAELDYRIAQHDRRLRQLKVLEDRKVVTQDEVLKIQEDIQFLRRSRELTVASQQLDEKRRVAQLQQLEDSVEQLQRNLEFARNNLDNLTITAPISGRISSLNAKLGESKARGERLGQIDQVSVFKIQADVDEFFLSRLFVGQKSSITINSISYQVVVDRIYPEVKNSRFKIDLTFDEEMPENLTRGQNIIIGLALAQSENQLVIPAGHYLNETGGHWVYVLNEENTATKRMIAIGRQSSTFIEVLQGLSEGEKIITSTYRPFENQPHITFKPET
ncbi:efflux RND transporter periplasmic adaptor subunit [Rheinheimera sp. YQF-2]|uniref:Efflux RND transporter periplasmic adaptor subunit n=1 Tax=Rheinheimera lutimaris TaxID=2740584 RepID=A0A7Y5ATX9_9GAMM|nr:efflux RND transporter periplasmic adaptor subunit [Rheinheimera lutimaris]NRQ44373.1 efflux RND transporter periplasmic adaptor subunit [Rheinheimera lutimaris]